MNAKELKRLLRKQTHCSYFRTRIPDKNYDVVRPGIMHQLIKVYREDFKRYEEEKWDCDDIARDFWNFAKRVLSDTTEGNGIVGMIDFPNHTQIVYVQERYAKDDIDHVYYLDQRDWSIYKPNRKPKWIIM